MINTHLPLCLCLQTNTPTGATSQLSVANSLSDIFAEGRATGELPHACLTTAVKAGRALLLSPLIRLDALCMPPCALPQALNCLAGLQAPPLPRAARARAPPLMRLPRTAVSSSAAPCPPQACAVRRAVLQAHASVMLPNQCPARMRCSSARCRGRAHHQPGIRQERCSGHSWQCHEHRHCHCGWPGESPATTARAPALHDCTAACAAGSGRVCTSQLTRCACLHAVWSGHCHWRSHWNRQRGQWRDHHHGKAWAGPVRNS